jgi:V8-like Glu-specific endopeptidase
MWIVVKRALFFGVLAQTFANSASAEQHSAVYDSDDRMDMHEVSDQQTRDWQRAVAAMVKTNRISGGLLTGGRLSGNGICSDVKFADQPTVARCTGFLVRDDILVTAGHCMTNAEDCTDFKWVFGFGKFQPDQTTYPVGPDDIYGCKRVLERKFEHFGDVDHAVILLDRPVVNRTPLAIRTEGKLNTDSKLLMIGFPAGLPAKVVPNGSILDNSGSTFFQSDLDTFGGNSGGPVFGMDSGLVEGIQTRGTGDFVWNQEATCKIVRVCNPGECVTAGGVRTTNIEYFKLNP